MICRRCKTAVSEKSELCNVCGSRLGTDIFFRRTLGIVSLIFILMLCIVYLIFKPVFIDEESTESAQTSITENPPDAEELFAEKPSDIPDSADANILDNAVTKELNKTVQEVSKYINSNGIYKFVSDKGYLYNYYDKGYVTSELLTEKGVLDQNGVLTSIALFYLYTAEVSAYFPAVDKADKLTKTDRIKNDMQLYAVCRSTNGVIISNGEVSVDLPEEVLNNILSQYDNTNGGEIYRPSAIDADYQNVFDAVTSYDFITDASYVRYMAVDDKYAVCVISVEDSIDDIKCYLLKRTDGQFNVIINNLQSEEYTVKSANAAARDMNLSLLPGFNLFYNNTIQIYDYLDIVDAAMSGGFINHEGVVEINLEDETLDSHDTYKNYFSYCSATAEGCYVVLNDSRMLVGTNENGWSMQEVYSWQEAEEFFLNREGSKPSYLIWQR